MSSQHQNLTHVLKSEEGSAVGLSFGIIVSEWNNEITYSLLQGARETLIKKGAEENEILIEFVPGAFELPLGAKIMARMTDVDAIICLGCVIRGETPHFDYVCQAASQGIMQVGLEMELPVIFGVLTVNNVEQALARSGGSLGNKGIEAAYSAIHMANLAQRLSRFESNI